MPITSRPLLIFSHGNSFPASTYGAMTELLRAKGYTVEAIEKLGHDPAYPVTSNWPHLVRQLADFTAQQVQQHGRPALLVGHSLGGFLSLMCAAQHPQSGGQSVQGVVLLDAPIIAGWRASMVGMAKLLGLIASVSQGAVSRKRRHHWPSKEATYLHFRTKKNFARWDDAAIHRYIEHGTLDLQGRRHLAFDRQVETAIYNALPHHLGQLMATHPPACPIAFIGGHQSIELKKVGLRLTKKVTQNRIQMVDGSHLFPIENPLATAAAIDAQVQHIMAVHAQHANP